MIVRISTILLLLNPGNGFAPIFSKPSCFQTNRFATQNPDNAKASQNRGFQQYGDIDPSHCTLSQDEILQRIKNRAKARRSQNFQKADEILAFLNRNNVHLNDSKKLFRADGEMFDIKGYSDMEYTKSGTSRPITESGEEYVNQKLRDRSKAKLRRDYDMADDILDELRFLNNVVVDDANLTWQVTEPFNTGYTYGGKRLNNVPEDEIEKIEGLIKGRFDAKKKREYDKADEILEDLKNTYGVRVDDAKKTWFFLPKFEEVKEGRESPRRGERDGERKWTDASTDARSERNKWSAIRDVDLDDDLNDIPDDRSTAIDDAPLPDRISIASDDVYIPDGIPVNDNGSDSAPSDLEESLSGYTVPILKQKLRDAGLPVSGKKSELIQRLIQGE